MRGITSFQVKWTESQYERGSLAGVSRWTAMLTVQVRPPRSADVLRTNPLGLYVDAIDWSRELDAPVPAKVRPAQVPPAVFPPANLPLGSPLDPDLGAASITPERNPE